MEIDFRLATLCVTAALLAPPPVSPQPPETAPPPATFGERIEVTAVSVPIRARAGKADARDLTAADLEVLEDGQPVTVLAVDRIGGGAGAAPAAATAAPPAATPPVASSRPWRIVLYFDLQMAGVTSIRQAAWELGGMAGELTALGEVEVVLVDDQPKRVFGPSRDGEALKKSLRKDVVDNFGQRRLIRLRQEFLSRTNTGIGLSARRGQSGTSGAEINLVRAFGFEEAKLLELRRQKLESYFAERSIPDWPQAAFLVTGGFDLEPGEFYLPLTDESSGEDADMNRLSSDFVRFSQSRPNDGVARQLAALGWTVFPVLPYDQDLSFTGAAESNRGVAWSGSGATPFSTVRHPDEPWKAVANITGGELVADLRKLDDAVAGLESRLLLTYQVARRKDGALHRLEVRSRRPGVEISAPAFVTAGTPEALAAARAKALLAGEPTAGDLAVTATVAAGASDDKGQSTGKVEAKVELAALGPARQALGSTTLRFTIAVPRPDGTVMVIHERAENADLRERAGWIFDAQLVAPKGTDRISVVVEELGTGAWGGAVARWGG